MRRQVGGHAVKGNVSRAGALCFHHCAVTLTHLDIKLKAGCCADCREDRREILFGAVFGAAVGGYQDHPQWSRGAAVMLTLGLRCEGRQCEGAEAEGQCCHAQEGFSVHVKAPVLVDEVNGWVDDQGLMQS